MGQLRFDNLWPEGGSIQIQHTGNFGTLARGIGITHTSGTLWGSYLYQAISVGAASIVDVRFTEGAGNQFADSNRRFRNLGDASSTTSQGGVGGGDTYTAASGPELNDGRVYLLIAKFDNVNQTGPAKWWALTPENYAAVLAMGLSEAALDVQCVDKLVVTGQPAATLSGTLWLQSPVYLGNALIDQIRYGTSLADVAGPAPVRWINLYREEFPNNTGNQNQAMSAVGWFAYGGANATDYTNTVPGSGTRAGTSFGTGSPSGGGFGFAVPEGDWLPFLVFTNEFSPINPADYQQLWFSWRQHSGGENTQFRLVVGIQDGQEIRWFASDAVFTNTGDLQTGTFDQFPTEAVLRGMLFSLEGSLWRDLTFSPGQTLSLASSARTQPLPLGSIVRAGLYLYGATTMRFDTFEIYGMVVPEPSTWVLLVLGAVLSMFGLLRRKT
ncbi:MAG: PEP-CTERM sorting domain-containing protein [Thermoguttaceae bacterium]|nr:PEP-CTERM sorting domain-containing protein [Thermoguttaceae bacterium]